MFAKLIYVLIFYRNNINLDTGLLTKSMRLQRRLYGIYSVFIFLKFGDSDGPNLCRLKKVDVSFTFIIFLCVRFTTIVGIQVSSFLGNPVQCTSL